MMDETDEVIKIECPEDVVKVSFYTLKVIIIGFVLIGSVFLMAKGVWYFPSSEKLLIGLILFVCGLFLFFISLWLLDKLIKSKRL